MFDAIFNWTEITARGVDATTYFLMATIGTLLFLIRLGAAMIGTDGETEIDLDSDGGFAFFSVLSILAFFMGAGWMGLACIFDWGLGRLPSAFIAAGFGSVMMLASAGMSFATRRLNAEAGYDPETAVGATGQVYLTIPSQGQGRGQVEVTVSGRKKILSAVSLGPEIPPFTEVVVREAQDDETLVVERKYPE